MEIVGVVGNRWAAVSADGKQVRTGEGPLAQRKDFLVVVGLEGGEVLRRDLTIPLSSKTQVRRVLPFQLEPLIPFPHEEAATFAQYFPNKQSTDVAVWIATQSAVERCIATANPDMVSCLAVALARWARVAHPDVPQLVAFTETLGIALDGEKIVSALSSPDRDKLHAFFKHKYPDFETIPAVSPFALPIGLALEAARKDGVIFWSKKTREERLLYKGCIASAAALLLCTLTAHLTLHLQEKTICRQFPQETVADFRKTVLHAAKCAPPVCLAPSVQETLSWLSSLKTPVQISHVNYELTGPPYKATLTLDFHAESEATKARFAEELIKHPSLIEPNHELTWTSTYRLSFPLRSL